MLKQQYRPWVLGVAVAALALTFVPKISQHGSHAGRMVIAALALLLVQAVFYVRARLARTETADVAVTIYKASKAGQLLTAAWLALAVYGAFNYYQFDRKLLAQVSKYDDVTYYYLNSKYFDELGYDNFYEAVLVADHEGKRRLSHVKRYRDLTNYLDLHPVSHAIDRAKLIKRKFTPARWEAFSHDAEWLIRRGGNFRYFFIDHGYNPPPTWTLIGGALSNLVPVESLKWLTTIDLALVIAMFVMVARSFGLQAMLIAVTFMLCTFSGRWPLLGQALLRFDWLAMLVAAACALKTGRHGFAGAALAYAMCMRIFPGVFALPYLAWVAGKWFAERRLPRELIRFASGATIVLAMLGGGAWARYGTATFLDAKERIAMHSSPESFSSHRLGLGQVLMYRGEWTRADINRGGGMAAKRIGVWGIYPALKLLGYASIVLVLIYAFRTKQPPHRLLWLGVFPLFCMMNPQVNYYNLRLLLLLFHVDRWREPRDRIGLSLLFAIEAATQLVHVLGADRYTTTVTASYGMLVYLVTMVGFLMFDKEAARPANTLTSTPQNPEPPEEERVSAA